MSTVYRPGDRVTGTFYGVRKQGTVVRVGPNSQNIIWVLWDGATREIWVHALSLKKAPAPDHRMPPASVIGGAVVALCDYADRLEEDAGYCTSKEEAETLNAKAKRARTLADSLNNLPTDADK